MIKVVVLLVAVCLLFLVVVCLLFLFQRRRSMFADTQRQQNKMFIFAQLKKKSYDNLIRNDLPRILGPAKAKEALTYFINTRVVMMKIQNNQHHNNVHGRKVINNTKDEVFMFLVVHIYFYVRFFFCLYWTLESQLRC